VIQNSSPQELPQKVKRTFQIKAPDGEFFPHLRSVHAVIDKPQTDQSAPRLDLEVSNFRTMNIGNSVKKWQLILTASAQNGLCSLSFMCYRLDHHERKTQEFVEQFQST
jgi:hypothetical protein